MTIHRPQVRQLEEMEAQAASANERAGILTQKLAQSLVDIGHLQTELRSVEEQLAQAQADRDAAQAQGRAEAESLEGRCGELESQKVELESQLIAITGDVASLQERIEAMGAKYRRDIARMTEENERLQGHIQSMESRR